MNNNGFTVANDNKPSLDAVRDYMVENSTRLLSDIAPVNPYPIIGVVSQYKVNLSTLAEAVTSVTLNHEQLYDQDKLVSAIRPLVQGDEAAAKLLAVDANKRQIISNAYASVVEWLVAEPEMRQEYTAYMDKDLRRLEEAAIKNGQGKHVAKLWVNEFKQAIIHEAQRFCGGTLTIHSGASRY